MADDGPMVRLQGPGGSVFKLSLGFSGLELSLNGDEVGVVGPIHCQQFAQAILARWPMGAAAVTVSRHYGRGEASGGNGAKTTATTGAGGRGYACAPGMTDPRPMGPFVQTTTHPGVAGAGGGAARTNVRVRARHDEDVVWEAVVPVGYPLPQEGEQLDIGERRYAVRSRVWSTSGLGDIDMTVDVHLTMLFERSKRPRRGHSPRCATLHGETCDCGAG